MFYAPLASDYVDVINGATVSHSGGTFTTVSDKNCVSFNADGYITWVGGSQIPSGSGAISLFGLVYLDNVNTDWRYMFGQCSNSLNNMFGVNNWQTTLYGRIGTYSSQWDVYPNTQLNAQVWYSICLTRDGSGNLKSYVQGV